MKPKIPLPMLRTRCYLGRWLVMLALVALKVTGALAQFTYTFAPSTPGYTNLSGGTNVVVSGSASNFLVDDAHSDAINLGFSFGYDGVSYTQVKVNTNGFILLEIADAPNNSGTADANTSWQNTNFATPGTSLRPLIAPLWDDHAGTSGTATYLTTGTAPNRVFTVEWRNWRWGRSAGGAVISFQCKLYETTNVIQFLYNQNGTAVNSGSASIGLLSGTAGNYISLNGTGATPTAILDPTAPVNTLSTKPGNGQMYQFTPSGCSGPAISSVTSNTPVCSTGTLNLTATATGTAPLSYAWTGAGTFSSTTVSNPSVTSPTSSTYSVTVKNWCGTSVNGNTGVTVVPTPSAANAGSAQSICFPGTATLNAVVPSPGTGSWTAISSGTLAQLSSTTANNAVFTPAASGTYTLTWTSANSPCTSSTAQVVITVNNPVTANAGSNKTVCQTPGTATMTANTVTGGSGNWTKQSGGGGGAITTAASPTTTITGLLASGSPYVYRWTATVPGCGSTFSDVTIFVDAPPTAANAGTDQAMCLSAGSMNMAANSPSVGTGSWTAIAGPNTSLSQIAPTNANNATFTPTTTGTYTLTWTTSNGTCATSSDNVVITVQPFSAAVSQTFNAGGTYIVPAGVTQIIVQAWGGGGAGGGTANTGLGGRGGAGGGGGAYVTKTLSVSPGDALGIVVGAQVNGTTGGNGGNGNPSTITGFTGSVFAAGGTGGPAYTSSAPTGGAGGSLVASFGDTKLAGTNGGNGSTNSGAGGAGANGGAGGTAVTSGSSAGNVGTAPGGGGSGGRGTFFAADQAGGAGAAGRVIITTVAPVPGLVASSTTICQGNNSTLTASGGSSYLWSPGGATTNAITVSPGSTTTYSVTVTNICPAYLTQEVVVVPTPNAGNNNTLTICSIDAAANMATLLGAHDAGSWSGPSAVVADMYDPATMNPGNYVYTVTAPPCANATATITVTENTATAWYADVDGDGFGNASDMTMACAQPVGRVANSTDCDDTQLLYSDGDGDGFGAGAPVACGVANNSDCNDAAILHADVDGDGFGAAANAPCGIADASDCDDTQLLYTDGDGDGFGAGAPVACGVTDNTDCNDAQLQYADGDGDGFGAGAPVACGVADNTDCNDAQLQYADGDGDGFGAGAPVACGVANNTDCNDNELQYADSDGDGFGAGSPIACGVANNSDDCPSVVGLIGSNCDAQPGPGFLLGQLNGSCNCIAVTCTQNVVLELRSDANSEEVGYEILDQNTNLVICSGGAPNEPFPHGITTPITPNCCLPVGCYRLRVMDAGGDGFVSGGITGGYQLRESGANGRRIIDNFGNFTNLAGGPPDVSTIANTYDNGAFCIPIGSDRPIFASCDKQDWVANQYIVATENASVTGQYGVTNTTSGYEFWFFDPNGSYSFRRFRNHATTDGYGTGATRACHFRLNSWTNTLSTPHLPNGVLLNVRIRGRVAGNNLPFGPACLFKMDAARAACPLVKLQDNPLNTDDFSCGVSRVFGGANSGANKLVANPPQFTPALPNASTLRYQFRFRLPGEYPNAGSCIVRPIQTSPAIYLNWATGDKLKCNTQYQVDLRVSKDGGATWCVADGEPTCSANPTIWGKVCNVNITSSPYCPNNAQSGSNSLASQHEGHFIMYPNPNTGERIFVDLSTIEEGTKTVSVDIFDMTGKRVIARTIPVQDGYVRTSLELNGDVQSGVYLVNVTAGTKAYTERLVIQR
jgi:hypothetical protein